MDTIGIAWVGTCHAMGGHRSMLMVMVWVWVQIRRKMLGSGVQSNILCLLKKASYIVVPKEGEEGRQKDLTHQKFS